MGFRQVFQLLGCIIGVLCSHHALAADQLYCPKSSQYIKLGMSTSAVQSACGTPVSQKKKKSLATKKVKVTQWFFRLGLMEGGRGNDTFTTGGNNTGTLVVTFEDNKVKGTSFNGTAAPSSSLCSDGSIQTGATPSQVSSSCGQPTYTNETYRLAQVRKVVESEIWVIKPSTYADDVTLTFENGVLKSIGN